MKTIILFFLSSLLYFNSIAQIVYIPDANFKLALINNLYVNTNADSNIQISEASVFSGTLNVSNLHISDLTGITSFTNLTRLICTNNQLTSLNLNSNTSLRYLYCDDNYLTGLYISLATSLDTLNCRSNDFVGLSINSPAGLKYLDCSANQLTNLNINGLTALKFLKCNSNYLTNLNVASNTSLTHLECSSQWLSNLDLSNNLSLTYLDCAVNSLTNLNLNSNPLLVYLNFWGNDVSTIDISALTGLKQLNCAGNSLTNLNINSNTLLTEVWCSSNFLSNIDISSNFLLASLGCQSNKLTSLDISLNNLNYLDCTNNPDLHCIRVSSAQLNGGLVYLKDANTYYSVNCPTSVSNFDVNAFNIIPENMGDFLKINGLKRNDEYKLYNSFGQLLISKTCLNENDNRMYLRSNADGLYILEILRNKSRFINKFMKNSY